MPILQLTIGWLLCILIAAFGALVLYAMASGKIDLSRLISEPNGDASLSRFQFLIFTFVVSLCLFLVVVGNGKPGSKDTACHDCPTFPDIPGSVLALLGISASSYLVSKGIQFSNDEGVRDRPPDVTVTPNAARLGAGETKAFKADVQRAQNTDVTWSVVPEVGTITANGTYTAPATLPQAKTLIQVIATSVADPNGRGHASITLSDGTQTNA